MLNSNLENNAYGFFVVYAGGSGIAEGERSGSIHLTKSERYVRVPFDDIAVMRIYRLFSRWYASTQDWIYMKLKKKKIKTKTKNHTHTKIKQTKTNLTQNKIK